MPLHKSGQGTLDVVERLRRFNAGREPERLTLKYRALRASPFAFFRGTAHLFWEDAHAAATSLPDSPVVWACGDLHLENFGSYHGDNDLAYFDLNDFDESARAPLSWEVARFVTSIFVAAPSVGLDAAGATSLVAIFLGAYRHALLESRTIMEAGERKLRIDRRRALPVTKDQRRLIVDCVRGFGETQRDPDFYKVLDVARRIAGKGSLGLQRYIALVRGEGIPDGEVLLDVKEARPSSLAPYAPTTQPVWPSEAVRIVTTQRRMQAIAPAFLHPVRIERTGFVMRELQPTEDRLRLKEAIGHPQRLRKVMETMGRLTAWAELRTSGRHESATADVLSAFARTGGWRQALIKYGRAYAHRVEGDYRRFVVAHEDDVIH